jgi:hypothetical protein
LAELRVWKPNLVSSRREIWVAIYGIPLHAWGEDTFRNIANRCGVFLEVDAGTRNHERFDVARVKLEAPLCGRIDFVLKLLIQGAGYVVRVVEESSVIMRDDAYVEDQMRRSEVGSSCASGGQGSVRAVLGGLDAVLSESDASEECQQNPSV